MLPPTACWPSAPPLVLLPSLHQDALTFFRGRPEHDYSLPSLVRTTRSRPRPPPPRPTFLTTARPLFLALLHVRPALRRAPNDTNSAIPSRRCTRASAHRACVPWSVARSCRPRDVEAALVALRCRRQPARLREAARARDKLIIAAPACESALRVRRTVRRWTSMDELSWLAAFDSRAPRYPVEWRGSIGGDSCIIIIALAADHDES